MRHVLLLVALSALDCKAAVSRPLCSFEGELADTVKLASDVKSTDAGDELRVEWTPAPAPNGARYVPPTRIDGAGLELFSSCPAAAKAFPNALPTFSTPGARALVIRLPKGWAAACAGQEVTLRFRVGSATYAEPCGENPEARGLPVHVVEGRFSLDARGAKVTSSKFKGGRFYEG